MTSNQTIQTDLAEIRSDLNEMLSTLTEAEASITCPEFAAVIALHKAAIETKLMFLGPGLATEETWTERLMCASEATGRFYRQVLSWCHDLVLPSRLSKRIEDVALRQASANTEIRSRMNPPRRTRRISASQQVKEMKELQTRIIQLSHEIAEERYDLACDIIEYRLTAYSRDLH